MARIDPLFKLGFGVCIFRDNLLKLIGMFTFFSLLVTPQIYTYANGGAYSSMHTVDYLELYSLGNLGYSSVKC